MKKFLSFMLSAMMLMSCISVTAFAQDTAGSTVTPFEFKFTDVGSDQGCSGKADATDAFGRAVQQVIPGDFTKNVAPATFFRTANYPTARNSAYRVIKFVYYTDKKANPNTAMSVWADEGPDLNKMVSRGKAQLYADDSYTAPNGGWNVAYYNLEASSIDFANGEFLFAFMFNMFSEAGSKHIGDTIYLGYAGLFDTLENAKAHVSAFEGDVKITDIQLGGTSIGNVATYSKALDGSTAIPELTVTATGNTNNITITNGTIAADGTATSTVAVNGEVVTTVSFTGGKIYVEPVETDTSWYDPSAQRCTGKALTDVFGRAYKEITAENQDNDSDTIYTGTVAPGGGVAAAGQTTDYKYLKLVYRSELTTVPALSAFPVSGSSKKVSCTSGATSLEAGKWHTVYFDYSSAINDALKMYMIVFTSDDVKNHIGEKFEIGYTGLFASLEDAQAHKSAFEGEFAITDVLLDGESIGNVTTYAYDLGGKAAVPVLTIKATGNTDDVEAVITNGVLSADGTAASKVTINGEDAVVVSFSGGSLDFSITDILVNGTSLENFARGTAQYTVRLPYASKAPTVTYTYDGAEKEVTVNTVANGGDYVTTLSINGEVKYTINFDVDDTKPTALLNTLYKLQNGENVTVGYFGGSVTGGTGSTSTEEYSWRVLTRKWMQNTFANVNTSIVERRATVGGTGSVYGVYRADRHFIQDKAPDLCFVEMAINDSYDGGIAGTNANYINAESIVRKIYASNPKADIIFILTGDNGSLRTETVNGTAPSFGYVYTNLGEYYDIPCIYVGHELAKLIYKENGNVYPSSSDAAWKKYYNDIVHPTNLGYSYYAATINEYLKFNLPVDYVPASSEFADKVLPEKTYCEVNGKGDLILDAYTVAGNELKDENGNVIANGAAALGGYYSSSNGDYRPLLSSKEGDVISVKFKASTIGAWTWAYNNAGGTNITYSIDGGAKKTHNFYLSSANHRYIFFGEGLDPEKEHVLRIYHDDSNTFDLRFFFLSGLSENITEDEMGITVVPVADLTATDDNGNFLFNVKVKNPDGTYREEITFHPAKSKYAVITDDATLAADGTGLPTIEVSVPEGYYGYEVIQATAENKVATFSIDNARDYTFAFMTAEEAEDFDDTEPIKTIKTPAKKMWGIVEGQTVNAPEAVTTETDVVGLSLTPVWTGADGFNFGDVAVGNELIAYTATYTAPAGFKFDASVAQAIENSVVSEDGSTFTIKLYTYVIPKDAIYIDDGGSDSTDDYAEGNVQKPYKTIDYAMSLLEAKGGGVIVIVDKLTETSSGRTAGTQRTGHYTIMGWDEESAFENTAHYNLRADTTFRDLNMWMGKKDGGIYTRGHALTLGDKNYSDLVVTSVNSGSKQIMMASDGGSFANPGKLTINSGSYTSVLGSGYNVTTVTGDIEIEMNGGSVDTLTLGLHCGAATSPHTINGNIKATINGGNITTLRLGSSGARYLHNGNCDTTINGGTINNILFRTASADSTIDSVVYPIQNGDYSLKINGGTITGKITDTSNGTTGVTGYTLVDIVDYGGDRAELLKKITTSQFDEVRYMVVYVDSENGAASNDGLTPEAALPTLTAAFAKFAGGVAGKIVLIGEVATHKYDESSAKYTDSLASDKAGRGHVTITGYDENAKFVFCKGITLQGPTTFENIHIVNSGLYANLFAGGHKLVLGEGITSSKTVSHDLQVGNGASGAVLSKSDIEIHSGTYGLIYSGADFNGGAVTGDVNLTIYGGTFNSDIYAGGYVSSNSNSVSDSKSGKIDGKVGLYIHGGTFNSTIYLGGNQYGTVGSAEAEITGGTFAKAINIGPNKPSATYTPADGEPVNYVTDILGDVIVNITGGTFTGNIVHTGNVIRGKAVVVASNGALVNFKNPEKFTYAVKASEKGTTTYDTETDKFSLVPVNTTMDIYVNDKIITKSGDNTYTLSGAANNMYNIKYGGETAISAKFIITPPMAELTPISEVILTGGKNTYNEIGNCTVSKITWEPAHTRFDFDTEYTAKVTLTAVEGIEFSDNLSGILINNNYAGNTVTTTLSEDKTTVEVAIKFPKTEKSDFDKLSETTTDVEVLFTTKREGEDEQYFHNTTVTLTNLYDDSLSVSGTATETGTNGVYAASVASGLYNITVKKNGYLEATAEAVMINSDDTFTIDLGELLAGDIIGENENTAGDGVVDIDDFIITLRGFVPEEDLSPEILAAADINETGVINVSQLGYIKNSFSKTSEDDASVYDGLFENTYYKLTVDKKLTVGYIGGSIIQGAGEEKAGNEKYIDRMHRWFNENFPEAEIHSINAGISNTGSNFANFRLEEDLMLRDEGYIPDLVFLEFCVNDFSTFGVDHIEMLYESLINNVYRINPNADIVCLLTAFSGYDNPKAAHIKIANHYGIPIIDLGTPMSTHYKKAGDCKIFTNDDLHPNGMGYEVYMKLTKNLLEKYIITGAPANPEYTAKVLPEPVYEQLLTNARAIPMTDASIQTSGSWTTGTISTGSRIFRQDKNAQYILSSTAGDTFTFTFNGDAFGFMVRKSAAMGTFEYSVDNGEWRECNFGTSQLYTHCQIFMPGTETGDELLTPGNHTVTVRVTGRSSHTDSTGCEVGIAGILYNAAE